MRNRIDKELKALGGKLVDSKVDLPLTLKLRTAEVVLTLLASRKRRFGLFVILGWKQAWRKYSDISDAGQDIFSDKKHFITDPDMGTGTGHDIAATLDFDGAILIDRKGMIVRSGVMIEGLRPRIVAGRVSPGTYADLSEQFGFKAKVHTRHLTAIAASYEFKGTTVFTVSEESDAFHVFEGGRIVHAQRRFRG